MPDGTTAEVTQTHTDTIEAADVIPGSVEMQPQDHSKQDGGVAHEPSSSISSNGSEDHKNQIGVVVPAPTETKAEAAHTPKPFSEFGYSKDTLDNPSRKPDAKPVGQEAMPPAKSPDGQRSALDQTVSPAAVAPDTKPTEAINTARAELDKHSKEIKGASPEPFSEHGYSADVLSEIRSEGKSEPWWKRLNPFHHSDSYTPTNAHSANVSEIIPKDITPPVVSESTNTTPTDTTK